MTSPNHDITRREFRHGKIAYSFMWNRTIHESLGKNKGDLASLWAHLSAITSGKMPDKPFTDPFYIKASSLQLPKLQAHKRVALRKRLERSGAIKSDINDDLVLLLRQYHRARNDLSYSADHSILTHFLDDDPKSIAIEVPVWSDRYRMSGHIDLVRYVDGGIQVCDYKPGKLETTKDRFLYSIPQVAAYGEMMAHHLASTLRSAIEAPLLPKVECCIFDTHACWRFGAELFVTLRESGHLTGV